jgi:hypothetical protein
LLEFCCADGLTPSIDLTAAHAWEKLIVLGVAPMRRLIQAAFLLAFGLAVSGCDKCGDWYFGPTQKTCHDESKAQ